MAKFIARITAKSYEELRNLEGYHLDLKKRTARQEDANRFIVTGILNDEQIQKVRSADYSVEVLSDLSQISKERIHEVSKANRFAQAKKTTALRESSETGGYMNADEIETALLNLAEAHQDIASVIEL